MEKESWAKVEVVIISAAMLLIALSLVLPEYKITTRSSVSGTPRVTEQWFYFDVFKTKSTTYPGGTHTSHSSYDISYPVDYTGVGDELGKERLWLACWIFLSWMLIAVLVYGREVVQITIGWMTAIAGLAAVAYPIVEVAGAIPAISGFFGSSSSGGVTASWGPSTAWYFAVVAEVLVGVAVVRRMSRFFMEPGKADKDNEEWVPPDDGTKNPSR